MKKVIYIMLLALVLTACGKADDNKTDIKQETVTDKDETKETETDIETNFESSVETQPEKESDGTEDEGVGVTQPNKDSSNTGNKDSNNNTTTEPSTGSNNSGSSNGDSGSAGNTSNPGSNNTGNTDSSNTETIKPSEPVHEHTWTEVTEEKIHYYAWRTICGKCKGDLTDLSADDITYHMAIVCNSGYSVQFIEVNYITENIQKEIIVTGYKCSCGETKEK